MAVRRSPGFSRRTCLPRNVPLSYLGDPEEMLARCMPLLADPDRMRGIGHAALDVLRG
ncbi:MAG: hypothetical protein WBF75_10510 [Pseudonocardiaceae bacterium]